VLLALDTATTTASIALYDPGAGELLAEQSWQARRRQTESLLPALQEMMARLEMTPDSLTALAVTTGPGSFTGVRIAISVAKGIALGLPQLPRLIGVPTLAVTAAPWLAPAAQANAQVWAVIQAGRGRFNWVSFIGEDPLWRPQVADHHAGQANRLLDGLEQATHPIWLVGELSQAVIQGADRLAHVFRVEEGAGWRRAGHLARLGHHLLSTGHEETLDSLAPLYLREPG
jgi:tRNA threonylcarbamoyladenosine biosynthesis protein TsaB